MAPEQSPMLSDFKIEAGKGTVAVAGGVATAVTLNQWVAIFTIVYIVVQLSILLHKHYLFIKDRKKVDK